MHYKYSVALLLLFISFFLNAQSITNEEVDTLFQLSLEELMNIKITVASQNEERISDAPGMITAYTHDEISKTGYYTISDLSDITSGYSSYTAYGEKTLETRGQKAGSWNNSKHLLLVDGIPINHVRAYSAPVEMQIPLFFADRVEFLKGPGSALYGVSAFYGVINVATSPLEEKGTTVKSKLSMGTWNSEKRIMASVKDKKDGGYSQISFAVYERDFGAQYLGPDSSHNDNRRNYDNDNSTFINLSHTITEGKLNGFSIGTIYMRKNSHMGDFWGPVTSPNNDITWEEIIPYVKYQNRINSIHQFKSFIKYNQSLEKSTYGAYWESYPILNDSIITSNPSGPIPINSTNGYSYTYFNIESHAELNSSINEKLNWINGLNYDIRSELGGSKSYTYTSSSPDTTNKNTYTYTPHQGTEYFNTFSYYSQLQYQIPSLLEGATLTAGMRLDAGVATSNSYFQPSPRIAFVQHITQKFNAKILYGQALRAPGIKEIPTNKAIREEVKNNGGNPDGIKDIKAEKIRSIEAGLTFTDKKVMLSVATFHNITIDALDGAKYLYTSSSGQELDPNIFVNSNGDIKSTGFEFDIQIIPIKQIRLFANYSFANARINDTTSFIKVPTHKINGGIGYQHIGSVAWSVNLIMQYRHQYKVDATQYGVDKIPGYTNVDLNTIVPITDNISIEVQVRNIFDYQFRQPAEGGYLSDMLYPGRRALFSLDFNF